MRLVRIGVGALGGWTSTYLAGWAGLGCYVVGFAVAMFLVWSVDRELGV